MEAALIALVALACPIGMGLMMWFMAKGMRGERSEESKREQPQQPSLAQLKAEHARLGAEIENLDEGAYPRERVASESSDGGP